MESDEIESLLLSFFYISRRLHSVLWENRLVKTNDTWICGLYILYKLREVRNLISDHRKMRLCEHSKFCSLLFLKWTCRGYPLCLPGGGVGLLLIRSWVLGNEAHENRNGVLLFYIIVCENFMVDLYFTERRNIEWLKTI